MGRTIVKFYSDGEFWIDGHKRAKLHPDGEIWADGRKIANLYEDGEIWMDGKRVGFCSEDGDLWINNRKVATGIHLLSVMQQPQRETDQSYESESRKSWGGGTSFGSGSGGFSGGGGGGGILGGAFFVVVLLLVAFLIACFKVWVTDMPQTLTSMMQSEGVKGIALVSVYVCMAVMLYMHWDIATRKNKPLFFLGLLLQGASFLVNLIVFTLIDLMATASAYGMSLFAGFSELGSIIGFGGAGGLFGMIFALGFMGLAPAIVGTLINLLYLKFKGSRENAAPSKLSFKKFVAPAKPAPVQNTTYRYKQNTTTHTATNTVNRPVPGVRPGSQTAPAKPAFASKSQKTKASISIGGYLGGLPICGGFYLVLLLMQMHTALYIDDYPGMLFILCFAAVIIGFVLRRNNHKKLGERFGIGVLIHAGLHIVALLLFQLIETSTISLYAFQPVALILFSLAIGVFVSLHYKMMTD